MRTNQGNDCVPIFKGTNYDALVDANGGSIPTDIPFIAISKDTDIFETMVINSSEPASIELLIDVTNDEQRTIYVPCGVKQEELLKSLLLEDITIPYIMAKEHR